MPFGIPDLQGALVDLVTWSAPAIFFINACQLVVDMIARACFTGRLQVGGRHS